MYNWNEFLSRGFSKKLVDHIAEIIMDAAVSEIDTNSINAYTGISVKRVHEFLTLLAQSDKQGPIQIASRRRCPHCANLLQPDSSEHLCNSTEDIVDKSDLMIENYFHLLGPQNRDIKWAIVIHGMNTRGNWQESLIWKLSNLYKFSIPVFVYKYGLVQIGAAIPFLQKKMVKNFADQYRRISSKCNSDKSDYRPDVIAHSFGTWIIANALKLNPDITIGRLILLGCIVEPDYNWIELLDKGQVQAILNHVAGKDKPVDVSQFFIPDSGPSGKLGFTSKDQRINNIVSPEFGHNGYFKNDRMTKFLSRDGVWGRFLSRPHEHLVDSFPSSFKANEWKPARKAIRYATRIIAVLIVSLLAFLPYVMWLPILKLIEEK